MVVVTASKHRTLEGQVLNEQWLLSFSPGDTARMKKVAVDFSVNKLGMTEEKIETY